MTVLVCIPYYRTPQYIERAVRSVLAQTHRDLVCVVIGDGDAPPLSGIRDDRLIVHSYPTNRGAYFAQDVAIWASPFEWYAIVASDDWVDPDHLERLLSHNADMACGALTYHNEHFCSGDPGHLRCSGVVVRKAYEVGIYRTERYRQIGAHNPTERIGQDSLTLKVMRLVAPVGATTVPTYHRLGREGSLCTAAETKNGSTARTEMRQRNRRIVARCEDIVHSGPAARDRGIRAARIRAYRESLVPSAIQAALDAEVDALRSKLGGSFHSGGSAWLGERGPELFYPDGDGLIVAGGAVLS